jgi:hypothetical protein
MRVACRTHCIVLDLITLTIKHECTNYEVRQYINVSSSRLLDLSYIPDILNPRHTVFSFLRTRDPVSHSYTTAGLILLC